MTITCSYILWFNKETFILIFNLLNSFLQLFFILLIQIFTAFFTFNNTVFILTMIDLTYVWFAIVMLLWSHRAYILQIILWSWSVTLLFLMNLCIWSFRLSISIRNLTETVIMIWFIQWYIMLVVNFLRLWWFILE